ncbi:hypothetical protein [Bradyrhizobium sp. STM 3809]|uniref:hypothetical protein n=1 Tax=Bradyrhizobium sp. STM 3809 TaxID=551936 RepID=UPI0002406AD4|nr:hypothetical protein [Bradyrhizobium sp. STM 3809]CCD97635.1 conserved hypothetical protein [Bradyrhizobium sp. STM 3809]
MSKPKYFAYNVRNYQGKEEKDQASWTKVGVAFEHKDGKGFDVVLEAFPVEGRITIREPREKK